MGVFDFVRHGTSEMRLARGSREPVFVHPELTLPLWGQLVVDDDDAAVFVNEGRVLGLVGPGRHVVHPSKLAFLEGFPDQSGRVPVRLVFVRLEPIKRARFTGELDAIADPATLGSVTPLVEGELTVQIVDPIAFVEDHFAGGEQKPILARRGTVAAMDGMRLTTNGRRVVVTPGDRLPRRTEPRSVRPSGVPMACRECGEPGELGAFCAGCGALVTDRAECVACRAELREGARFCAACGIRVARD